MKEDGVRNDGEGSSDVWVRSEEEAEKERQQESGVFELLSGSGRGGWSGE